MTDGDAARAARGAAAGRSRCASPTGGEYHVRLVASDPDAYDRFYNVFANPMLWFIQHYLWDLSQRAGHPPQRGRGVRVRLQRRQRGPRAGRRSRRSTGGDEPVVMVHDYHLYTLPGARAPRAAGRLPAPLHPHPVDAVGRLARAARTASARSSTTGCWPTTSSASTRGPTGATSCSAAATCWTSRSTSSAGVVHFDGPRGVGAQLPAADRRRGDAARRRVRARAARSRRSCCAAGATT